MAGNLALQNKDLKINYNFSYIQWNFIREETELNDYKADVFSQHIDVTLNAIIISQLKDLSGFIISKCYLNRVKYWDNIYVAFKRKIEIILYSVVNEWQKHLLTLVCNCVVDTIW